MPGGVPKTIEGQGSRSRIGVLVASRLGAFVGASVIALSFVLPEDGFGFSLCWFNSIFDLPCPGCGLTRSVIHISHGRWEAAWNLHPFGYLVYAIASLAVLLGPIPDAVRHRAWDRFGVPGLVRDRLVVGVLFALALFGLVRLLFHVLTGVPFPTPT